MFSRRLLAVVALVILAISWGAIPLIVREDIPWQSLVASRVWLGAITLLIIMGATKRLRLPATHRRQIVAAGVLLALHWATFFWAIKLTTVAVALAVVYLGPVAAAVLAPRFLHEAVPRRIYGALAMSFAGVVLVVAREGTADGATSAGSTWKGVGIALVSATAVLLLMLVSKLAVNEVGALVVTTGEMVTAAIVLSPWAGGAVRELVDNPVPLLILGVVLTGLGFLTFWTAMRELPVATVSVLMHLEPASAVVLAMIFLDEIPDALQWLGIGMVITGGLMAARDAAAEEVVGVPANL
ncbi:MAG: DMT family transporter [Actinomycetota bacterium]|nr:DMT family transporter [Actinomycetota bacterium]